MKIILLASAAAATLFAATPAQAQDGGEDYRVRLGLGGQVRPQFPGAKDKEVVPYVDVDVARGDKQFGFEALDESFGIPVYSKNGFAFGPAANIEGKRRQSDVGLPVGNVPMTFEVGAFTEYYATKSFRLRGELRKGVNGHEGLIGSIAADHVWRDGDKYLVSIGPRLFFADSRYQRAYYGVDSSAALASGLPAYRPGGGLYSAALASGMSYQFDDRWGVFGYGRYERLLGDAAKSPIVRSVGSRNQLSGGLGLSYTFRVRR